MSRDIETLRDVLSAALTRWRERQGKESSGTSVGLDLQVDQELLDAVLAIDRWRVFVGKLHAFPDCGITRTGPSIALSLRNRAAEVGVEAAIGELDAFSRDQVIPLRRIWAIGGVSISHKIDIGNGYCAVPWGSVASNPLAKHLATQVGREFSVPGGAIVHDAPFRVLLFDPSSNADRSGFPRLDNEYLLRFIEVLAVLYRHPAFLIGGWLETQRTAPVEPGGLWFYQLESLWSNHSFPLELESEVVHMLMKYGERSERDRSVLRLAMDRYCIAMRRTDLVSRAVDLRIAAEAMLLSDQKDGGGEKSFRLATRGARFVGRDAGDRIDVGSKLKQLYDIGSVAVHTGQLPSQKKGGSPVVDQLGENAAVLRLIARRLICEGAPNWKEVDYSW